MPALPNVPNVARVILKYTLGEDIDVINRLFRSWTGSAPSASDCTTFATTISGAWTAHMAALSPTDLVLKAVLVEDLSSSSGGVGESTGAVAGTRAGATLPAGVAAVVSH